MKQIMTILAVAFLAGCATTSSQDEAAVSRLQSVIVPEVDFRDAAMSDVVEFVANSWHCVCHPWIHPTQKIAGDSVTYHFHVDEYDPHDSNSSIALVKGINETSFVRLGPTVTFHAEKINIHDLLKQLVEQVDGTVEITGNDVTITTKVEQPPAPLQNESAVPADPF